MTNAANVRLGDDHGYRLDGDRVHLHASFVLDDAPADPLTYSLQLWAYPIEPIAFSKEDGTLIAELPLPSFGQLLGEPTTFAGSAFVTPPAGREEQFMALALASNSSAEVLDFKVYPYTQAFLQPRLTGRVEVKQDGEALRCVVQRIENPREAGTSSGTLSLELWALSAPYRGGLFQGAPLAGAALDAVAGQDRREDIALDFPLVEQPADHPHRVLMLREWTPMGYVTRDFYVLEGAEAWSGSMAEEKSVAQVAVAAPLVEELEELEELEEPASVDLPSPETAAVKGPESVCVQATDSNALASSYTPDRPGWWSRLKGLLRR